MQKPKPLAGLRHVALYVHHFAACLSFYSHLLGMKIVWQPDEDNVYLASDNDNLALHRAPADFVPAMHQRLDHIGFFLSDYTDVDEWYAYLSAQQIEIKAMPKDHRDGTRSFYCADPDGNIVQLIYCPQ